MNVRQIRGRLIRIFNMFNRKRREREFAEELESHLALHIEDNLRAGMSPEEARRVALVKLGGVTQVQELHREQRGLPMNAGSPVTPKGSNGCASRSRRNKGSRYVQNRRRRGSQRSASQPVPNCRPAWNAHRNSTRRNISGSGKSRAKNFPWPTSTA